MIYVHTLDGERQVRIENQGRLTVVTLHTEGPGQRQSQSQGFETGNWTAPPGLFRTPDGLLARIELAGGPRWIQVKGSGITLLPGTSAPAKGEPLPLDRQSPEADPGFVPMEPLPGMPPLPPMEMRMGSMEMRTGEMKMGDMEMCMGPPAEPHASRRFCSQCGQAVAPSDRYCSGCGQRLTS